MVRCEMRKVAMTATGQNRASALHHRCLLLMDADIAQLCPVDSGSLLRGHRTLARGLLGGPGYGASWAQAAAGSSTVTQRPSVLAFSGRHAITHSNTVPGNLSRILSTYGHGGLFPAFCSTTLASEACPARSGRSLYTVSEAARIRGYRGA